MATMSRKAMAMAKQLKAESRQYPKLTMRWRGKVYKTKYAIVLEKIAWWNHLHPARREAVVILALGLEGSPYPHLNPVMSICMHLPYDQLPPLVQVEVVRCIEKHGNTYRARPPEGF